MRIFNQMTDMGEAMTLLLLVGVVGAAMVLLSRWLW